MTITPIEAQLLGEIKLLICYPSRRNPSQNPEARVRGVHTAS